MVYLRTAIILTVTMLIVLILVKIAMFDPDEQLNNSLNLYLEGNYTEADEALSRLESSLAPMQFFLYKAYVDRAAGNMELAVKDLEKAEAEAVDHANFPLLLEIILNEALNAYLSKDRTALAEAVKKAMKYGGPNQDWVLLFRGIIEYQEEDYEKALTMWKLDASRTPLSAWMQKPFQSVFTPYWFVVHIARADIETGKISSGRELLEAQIPTLSGEELNDILFLMGYSYAKEAADKGPAEAAPYYKLALSYFAKTPFLSDRYSKERAVLIKQISAQTEAMLQSGDYKNLPYYLSLLDRWQARDEVSKVKDLLIVQFRRSVTLNSVESAKEIFEVLRPIVPEGTERQALEESLSEAVGRTNLENLDQYARSGRIFLEESEVAPAPSAPQEKVELIDPVAALVPIQGLIEAAINDKKINPEFRIDRSVDLQKALKLLNSFVEEHKDIPQAYMMLGQVRYLLGDLAGAAKAYELGILLDPRDPLGYRYMALVYEAARQAQDAILLLLQALKYAPKNPDIWEQLGGLYLVTGNELDALPSYKEALHIDPERHDLYLVLGRLQVKLEMPEDASVNLRKYLDEHPDSQEALRLLLMSLYNPLLNVNTTDLSLLEKQREEIYRRLYEIAPHEAEMIRKSYHAPPPVVSPPPQPEPNLPFLPQ